MSSARYQSAQSQTKCDNRLENNRRIILENCAYTCVYLFCSSNFSAVLSNDNKM